VTDEELVEEIQAQRDLMISVSTGGDRIQSVNDEYKVRRERIRKGLEALGIKDPNPHSDLWRWYGKWSSGDLPTYQSRRLYISDLYDPLVDRLRQGETQVGSQLFAEPTGWARVDRAIDKVRERLETASAEEDYQTVGLLCREALISLAQAVYDSTLHAPPDGDSPSDTDAKRMLEGYVAAELPGSSNEEVRKHVNAALALANSLVHRRTATFRDAAMCAESLTAVVNLIAIASGRRDPIQPKSDS
jgi:hypothetical protein